MGGSSDGHAVGPALRDTVVTENLASPSLGQGRGYISWRSARPGRRSHPSRCLRPKSSLLTWSASSMGRARASWPPSSNKPQQERAFDCDVTGQNGWGTADHFGRSSSGFRKGHCLIGTAHKYADGHVLYRREAIRTTRGVTLARPPCDLRGRTLA